MPRLRVVASYLVLGCAVASSLAFAASSPARSVQPRWFKGNLHTHSLWSDGDDYPEMIADWYKRNGYNFLGISDHNVLQEGPKWHPLKQAVAIKGEVMQRGAGPVLEKYLQRFGADWVELKDLQGRKEVRLKPLNEYRSLLEETGRFLMIPSEEISSSWARAGAPAGGKGLPVHINITNPRELVAPETSSNATETMQRILDVVARQREKTGQPMFAHINHPNWRWGLTAEEIMKVKGMKFFEVYNGHPGVENHGDATRLGMDAMWDIMLAFRLGELNMEVVYGVGVDDSHNYHEIKLGRSNPGRGWVMVRARHLTPDSIVLAMEAGDFYASNGVKLRDVTRAGKRLAVEIEGEPGVTYTTQFIGTRIGFDRTSELMNPPADEMPPRTSLPHRRYRKDVGAVLKEVKGTSASYELKGDELYVRAKVISSKPKVNGSVATEMETAWTQPLVNEQ